MRSNEDTDSDVTELDTSVDMSALFPNDPPETLCVACARPYSEHETYKACRDEEFYFGVTPELMQRAWESAVQHMLKLGMDPDDLLRRAGEVIASWKSDEA